MHYFITSDFAENGQFPNKKGNWKIKLKLSRRRYVKICQLKWPQNCIVRFCYHFDWTATLTTIWKHCATPNCLVHFFAQNSRNGSTSRKQTLEFWLTLGWGVGGGSIIFQKAGGLAITTILANITGTNNSFQNLTGSFKIYFFILAHEILFDTSIFKLQSK